MRIVVTFIVCVPLAVFAATAQYDQTKSTGTSSPPTLAEVKAAGRQRSKFRTQTPQIAITTEPKANLKGFREEIAPILKKNCVRCHGPKKQEGNIRLDTLNPDLLHGDDVKWWIEIAGVLGKGEMPPADAAQLTDKDHAKLLEWLSTEIRVASAVRREKGGHSSFRRMTRYEFNYALQDLLGLPYNFAKDLPPEPNSEDGFQNSSENLHMSSIQFGTYRELSRKALREAIVLGKQPAPLYWGVSMKAASAKEWAKQKKPAQTRRRPGFAHYKNLKSGQIARTSWRYPGAKYAWKPSATRPNIPKTSDIVAVIPPRQRLIVELGDRIPEHGLLRVRVRAARTSAKSARLPSLQLEFGWQASNDSQATVRISDRDIPIDAAPDKPKFYQWEIPLRDIYPRNSVRKISKMGDLPSPSEYVKFVNSSVTQGDIQIDYVEITAPIYKQWPPKSHTRILFDSDNKAKETVYAREVLKRFMSRAWRRRISDQEIDQKLTLFKTIRPNCDNFEDAMVEVLATVLSSPKFLYLVRTVPRQPNGKPNADDRPTDFELATRLSMFLWSSTPDDELLQLAAKNQLNDSKVLRRQVQRMLSDSRSRRFSKHFVRQWLGMQLLDHLKIDRKTYPQFQSELKEAMQEEPIAFFHEVLRTNRSVLDFVHADYTMLNERLAKHYGIDNVHGNQFRRVKLNPNHQRGGLLTQAGLLAMNSDGKDSHPLKRGIWLLNNLLNDPPPPPPPAVPEIDLADPKIAKLTLKQRIENHRNHAACMSCHVKIDPWGIAFENFDAVGSWRTAIKNKPVDATSRLFNKQKLAGMDGLKRYLLTYRQDQFARAIVQKMTTYALGRPLSFGDRSSIDRMTADLRKKDDGLATLVTIIVMSDLFRSK